MFPSNPIIYTVTTCTNLIEGGTQDTYNEVTVETQLDRCLENLTLEVGIEERTHVSGLMIVDKSQPRSIT